MIQIEKYNIFEKTIKGPKPTGSSVKVEFVASFQKDEKDVKIKGFYNGNGEYVVRFMPDEEGVWHYELTLKETSEEINESGKFECIKPTGQNHGPVVTNKMSFQYADGTRYIPFGTTIYAWIHQPKELIKQTIETLSKSPFNKVRMCVFPKSLFYNNNEPELFPFEKDEEGKWDVHQPNFKFWNHLETQVKALLNLGIEVDLILFHPYDRWGFSKLGLDNNLTYLDYCIRRLAAFRNIWWSLANEYDTVFSINEEDWEVFGKFIRNEDVYNHLLSNHNLAKVYDASKPWITHSSIQTNSYHKTKMYRDRYQKPVMIDECRYEGNVEHSWGNITAFEMVHRFWAVMVLGGYCTHGETYHRDDEVLWWAKGGKLYGESVERIAFLKSIMYELEGEIQPDVDLYSTDPDHSRKKNENDIKFEKVLLSLDPVEYDTFRFGSLTNYSGRHEDKFVIKYLGRERPCILNFELPDNGEEYRIEIIDIWEMTRETVVEKAIGDQKLDLPGKEGIAVLATKVS